MHGITCPPSLLLCKIHDSKVQPNLPKQVCARPIVCFIKRLLSLGIKYEYEKKSGPKSLPKSPI